MYTSMYVHTYVCMYVGTYKYVTVCVYMYLSVYIHLRILHAMIASIAATRNYYLSPYHYYFYNNAYDIL